MNNVIVILVILYRTRMHDVRVHTHTRLLAHTQRAGTADTGCSHCSAIHRRTRQVMRQYH